MLSAATLLIMTGGVGFFTGGIRFAAVGVSLDATGTVVAAYYSDTASLLPRGEAFEPWERRLLRVMLWAMLGASAASIVVVGPQTALATGIAVLVVVGIATIEAAVYILARVPRASAIASSAAEGTGATRATAPSEGEEAWVARVPWWMVGYAIGALIFGGSAAVLAQTSGSDAIDAAAAGLGTLFSLAAAYAGRRLWLRRTGRGRAGRVDDG